MPCDVILDNGTSGSAHRMNFGHNALGAGLLASSDDVKNSESPRESVLGSYKLGVAGMSVN